MRAEGIANHVENCVAAFVRRLQLPKTLEGAEVRTKVMLEPAKPAPSPRGGSCLGLGCGRLGG